MSVPNFCNKCGNLLRILDMYSGVMRCSGCGEGFECGDNRVVYCKYYNTGKRMLSDNDITRLMYEPTTQKVKKDCPSCKGEIMACIIDENCKAIIACLSCQSVFR